MNETIYDTCINVITGLFYHDVKRPYMQWCQEIKCFLGKI